MMPRVPQGAPGTSAALGLACGGVGAALTALLVVSGGLDVLEWSALDARQRAWPAARAPERPVRIVAVDQGSLEAIATRTGFSWPWPREFHGRIVDVLARAGARTVVFDVLFLEPDVDRAELPGAQSDQAFARALSRHGRVLLAGALGADGGPSPPAGSSTALPKSLADLGPGACQRGSAARQRAASLPIPPLAAAAAGVGAANLPPDDDGILRRLTPTFSAAGRCVPSLALAAARFALGSGTPAEVRVEPGRLHVGPRWVPLDDDGRVVLGFYGAGFFFYVSGSTFSYTPVHDLLLASIRLEAGDPPGVDLERFRDRVVVVGATAPGLFDLKPTPMSSSGVYPGVEILATAVENLVGGQAVRRPAGLVTVLLATLLALVVGLAGALRPSFSWQVAVTVALAGAYVVAGLLAFARARLALDLVAPVAACLVTAVAALGWRYLVEGRQRRRVRQIFQHYVAAPVVRDLLADPDALRLGGERRDLTVFFSDIVGFTDISESMPPEDLVHLLNDYFRAVGGPILERRGFIDKYIGDAVMAIFGAPVAHARQAADAVTAALLAHRAAHRLCEGWKDDDLPVLKTRIGLATGPAVLGNIGSEGRINYTAVGDTVNLASRLEAANKVFRTQTLICARTFELAQDAILARPLGRVIVKGKRKAVRVYEPLALAGEECPLPQEFLDAFEQGIDAYIAGELDEAVEAFCEAEGIRPLDRPARLYGRMAERRRRMPGRGDWDGTLRLDTKAIRLDAVDSEESFQ